MFQGCPAPPQCCWSVVLRRSPVTPNIAMDAATAGRHSPFIVFSGALILMRIQFSVPMTPAPVACLSLLRCIHCARADTFVRGLRRQRDGYTISSVTSAAHSSMTTSVRVDAHAPKASLLAPLRCAHGAQATTCERARLHRPDGERMHARPFWFSCWRGCREEGSAKRQEKV